MLSFDSTMHPKTASVLIHAPKDVIFFYLSNIDNLPKWATIFCKELKMVNGKKKIVSPIGELFFEIKSDFKTGIVDMFAGPMFQTLGISDSQFDLQY